ncbi:MAG: hypothetical protein M1389_12020 [Chloroflexi bacterium]|nr:hypothetical protein [Chloroflexota bacterium]
MKVFQRHRDDDPNESCPAQEFFSKIPDSVATDLFAIIDAVAESPPPQFSGGGMWEAMHGEMAGYYEARTRGPDRRLHRVFCFVEREAPGLDRPSVVVLTGLSKPVGKAVTKAYYAAVRRIGEEYRRRAPRSVV